MRFSSIVGLALLCASALPAMGQSLPNHSDPQARDIVPNLSAVPAIRFLTTADFPPFNYRDESGQLVGFNIDLARGICAELNVACTIQSWPWDQAAKALADNQGDALIAGLAITPENGDMFDFSSIYLMLPGRFVTAADKAAAFEPRGLGDKVVAVRKGSAHEEFVKRYLPNAKPLEFDSEGQALEAVRDGKAEAFFGDAMRASFWLSQNGECCSFAGDPYFRPDLFGEGLAIAQPTGHDAVRKAIDYALARLSRDGKLDEFYLRWFPVSFY
ncbi:transporter substrate-binding domain-containing protein [Paradevosia shaoguanensis]|jgi:polar amino acid transport system substrate-binding protein|uniref:Transporter substrate-binding domain-containing protein n=1 Tax=Paradevosia shaoguanensis TaxID=1335043 RepID=A0AA41QLA9_9HYPH|nr:transporter substrate-binding domain-containing protein [Paradevosia shaoguanensis]MBI4048041.1 transporter substrate-binding domain-containing protein [Devosia nanyangense]QMV03208.1 transporter substrate-binding domain-containing protein [Devosia sp. D6-9]CDP51236.1 Bacterial extracellular solute-binding protein, fa mily 3 [Devosia sp. DBB001]MCF1741406.1 transporter substrate-binding domain-containing protein [Paradevosia shaoguanensis]MCI0125889.1 transporter substrate-binding domain-co